MELESQLAGFKKRGLGVAALSYDSVDVLKDFTKRRGITYPLLSDPESKIIRAYGIINEIDYAPGTPFHGIPFPGTFVADAKGRIVTKDFEKSYQERQTAGSLLTSLGDTPEGGREMHNDQLLVTASISNPEAAPGQRISLILQFKMAPGLHAYAPGVTGYRPLKLTLAANPFVSAREVIYPASRPYTFAPLNETVPVFEGDFRITQDVTVLGPQRGAGQPASVVQMTEVDLSGTLDYQTCSDTLCHAPASMPVQWAIKIVPLDRVRAPEAMRKKTQ